MNPLNLNNHDPSSDLWSITTFFLLSRHKVRIQGFQKKCSFFRGKEVWWLPNSVEEALSSTKLHQCHNPSSWCDDELPMSQQLQKQHQNTKQPNQPTQPTHPTNQPTTLTTPTHHHLWFFCKNVHYNPFTKRRSRCNQDLWSFSSPHQWPCSSHLKRRNFRLVDLEVQMIHHHHLLNIPSMGRTFRDFEW